MPLHEQYLEAFKSAPWLFQSGVVVVLLLSLFLFMRGLFADRSRGRKRCPKCWFSLEKHEFDENHAMTCPECGRVIMKTKHLHKRRRSRLGIVLGVIVALIAIAAPKANQDGLHSAVPMPILVLFAPGGDAGPDWATHLIDGATPAHWIIKEYIRRRGAGELTAMDTRAMSWLLNRDFKRAGTYGAEPESQRMLETLRSVRVPFTRDGVSLQAINDAANCQVNQIDPPHPGGSDGMEGEVTADTALHLSSGFSISSGTGANYTIEAGTPTLRAPDRNRLYGMPGPIKPGPVRWMTYDLSDIRDAAEEIAARESPWRESEDDRRRQAHAVVQMVNGALVTSLPYFGPPIGHWIGQDHYILEGDSREIIRFTAELNDIRAAFRSAMEEQSFGATLEHRTMWDEILRTPVSIAADASLTDVQTALQAALPMAVATGYKRVTGSVRHPAIPQPYRGVENVGQVLDTIVAIGLNVKDTMECRDGQFSLGSPSLERWSVRLFEIPEEMIRFTEDQLREHQSVHDLPGALTPSVILDESLQSLADWGFRRNRFFIDPGIPGVRIGTCIAIAENGSRLCAIHEMFDRLNAMLEHDSTLEDKRRDKWRRRTFIHPFDRQRLMLDGRPLARQLKIRLQESGSTAGRSIDFHPFDEWMMLIPQLLPQVHPITNHDLSARVFALGPIIVVEGHPHALLQADRALARVINAAAGDFSLESEVRATRESNDSSEQSFTTFMDVGELVALAMDAIPDSATPSRRLRVIKALTMIERDLPDDSIIGRLRGRTKFEELFQFHGTAEEHRIAVEQLEALRVRWTTDPPRYEPAGDATD